MKYPVTHEYLSLIRYMYRHHFNASIQCPAVDPAWFEAERKAIALLLAEDNHPSKEEYYAMALKYGIMTYFPFMKEVEE